MQLSPPSRLQVRLWNIPEQRVVSWQDVHEMVTAVSNYFIVNLIIVNLCLLPT